MQKFFTFLVISLFLLPPLLFSWARRDFFINFPNYYFVETGTMEGHGLCEATRGEGFEEFHSIELSEYYYLQCKNSFRSNPKVHLWLGDSGKILSDVIHNMNKPITFWLDSHYSGPNTSRGETNSPLMQELECIKNHPIKNHTIIIDDVRLLGTAEFDDLPLGKVLEKIREINPTYEFEFCEGAYPQDILVARPGR